MLIDPETVTLDQLIACVWALLNDGVARRDAAFHTPVFASQGEWGPDARTVVLRAADAQKRQVICQTDTRSPKVLQLTDNPRVAWVFYDPEQKLQLRLHGLATLHDHDTLARSRWEASAPASRACYANSPGPGARVAAPDAVSSLDEAQGYRNFLVISCEVQHLDWLFLSANHHRRARFSWQGNAWHGHWVAP